VFAFNSSTLDIRIDNAVEILNYEGYSRQPVLTSGYAGVIDNYTDRQMIGVNAIRQSDMSPLVNALSVADERYWSGYLIALRPLLMVMGYGTIRYINMYHMLLLIIVVSIMLQKRLNIMFALLLGFILATWYVNIFPFSLQFSNVFYVMMYSIVFILWKDKKLVCENKHIAVLFLIIGSVVNFFDLLTYPLVTLCIPLTICYILRQKHSATTAKNNTHLIILASGYWAAGYAITWACKWVLGGIVKWMTTDMSEAISLSTSTFDRIIFRIVGNEEHPLNMTRMFQRNITTMYPRILVYIICVLLIFFIILLIKKRKSTNYLLNASPLLMLCIFPYVWFLVFAGHSDIHFWFTYRIQAITIFALFSYILSCFPDNMNIMHKDFWKPDKLENE